MPRSVKPGRPVRGSRTGRPVMAAFDLLGRRWAMRVLWELRTGPVGFREMQARCDGMSSSVLRDRFRELEAAGLIARGEQDGYELTGIGRSLRGAVEPLEAWARLWAAEAERRPKGRG